MAALPVTKVRVDVTVRGLVRPKMGSDWRTSKYYHAAAADRLARAIASEMMRQHNPEFFGHVPALPRYSPAACAEDGCERLGALQAEG